MKIGELQYGDKFVLEGTSGSSIKMVIRQIPTGTPKGYVSCVSLITGHVYDYHTSAQVERVVVNTDPLGKPVK